MISRISSSEYITKKQTRSKQNINTWWRARRDAVQSSMKLNPLIVDNAISVLKHSRFLYVLEKGWDAFMLSICRYAFDKSRSRNPTWKVRIVKICHYIIKRWLNKMSKDEWHTASVEVKVYVPTMNRSPSNPHFPTCKCSNSSSTSLCENTPPCWRKHWKIWDMRASRQEFWNKKGGICKMNFNDDLYPGLKSINVSMVCKCKILKEWLTNQWSVSRKHLSLPWERTEWQFWCWNFGLQWKFICSIYQVAIR